MKVSFLKLYYHLIIKTDLKNTKIGVSMSNNFNSKKLSKICSFIVEILSMVL